jgi:hypothetical protein
MRKENPDQEDARRFDVELFIVHPTVDPEEIGRALGLEARFLQRAGEERTTPAGRPLSGVCIPTPDGGTPQGTLSRNNGSLLQFQLS